MIQKYLKDSLDTNEEKQIIPVAGINNISTNKNGIFQGDLTNIKKMIFVDFEGDQLRHTYLSNQTGAKFIKVREDIVKDLKFIKSELNAYNVPLSFQSFEVTLNNQYLSDFGRVGLEIMLNPNAAMTETKNPDYSDYYVGPDPLIKNKLRVYAVARKDFSFTATKYIPSRKILNVYDIRQTYGKYPPETIKVFKNVIDLTKMFEDQGFIQQQPMDDFYKRSDNMKSNWFMFYKPSKINIGYTYKELLLTVYDNNGESIWHYSNRIWDGKKFNGSK